MTHYLLVPRLRTHGTIPIFPQYVFMASFMAWYLVKHKYNVTFYKLIVLIP